MQKVLSIAAVATFMLTASSALAGGPGKRMMDIPAGCNEECQAQLDELQAGQAQQNELLNAHSAEIEALKNREELYNPFYVRGAFKFGWGSQSAGWKWTGLNTGFVTDPAKVSDSIPGTRLPTGYFKDSAGKIPHGAESSLNHTGYIDSKTYFGGQGAIGKYLFKNFRVELEYAYQGADVDGDIYDGDVDLHTVMVNAYYEIPITDMFGLYGVVGGGYGNYSMDARRTDVYKQNLKTGKYERKYFGLGGSSDVFAYKIGAGMSIFFLESRNLALDIGYEYLGTTDPHLQTSNHFVEDPPTDLTSVHSHNIVTSLRFMF